MLILKNSKEQHCILYNLDGSKSKFLEWGLESWFISQHCWISPGSIETNCKNPGLMHLKGVLWHFASYITYLKKNAFTDLFDVRLFKYSASKRITRVLLLRKFESTRQHCTEPQFCAERYFRKAVDNGIAETEIAIRIRERDTWHLWCEHFPQLLWRELVWKRFPTTALPLNFCSNELSTLVAQIFLIMQQTKCLLISLWSSSVLVTTTALVKLHARSFITVFLNMKKSQ